MPLSNGQRLCTAHKRDGTVCSQVAITGRTKCKMHGGKSLGGSAHPNYKHGRYSDVIPAQLAQHYHEFRASPRLMSLSEEIAVQQAHLADLLGQVGTGESGAAWAALQDALDAFSAALARQDQAGMNTHYATLRRIVGEGSRQAGLWKEIQATCETVRGLVSTETKTLLGMQQLITVQQHMLMLGAVHDVMLQAVKAHTDTTSGRKILMAVEAGFTKLATREVK
jgi:hypothetical protein